VKASQLQKRCDCATAVKQRAIQRAKSQTWSESRSHKLIHKGVYTEDTRNLIRLLVKAGCSREHVSKVIHAIFKVAGISIKGGN
jgi:hypothetical protein